MVGKDQADVQVQEQILVHAHEDFAAHEGIAVGRVGTGAAADEHLRFARRGRATRKENEKGAVKDRSRTFLIGLTPHWPCRLHEKHLLADTTVSEITDREDIRFVLPDSAVCVYLGCVGAIDEDQNSEGVKTSGDRVKVVAFLHAVEDARSFSREFRRRHHLGLTVIWISATSKAEPATLHTKGTRYRRLRR
jgi:hypothetical protein